MERFLERHRICVFGVVTGFDRINLRGTLRSISYVEGLDRFSGAHRVLLAALARRVEVSREVPDWDQASLKKVREALLALAAANGGMDSVRMSGRKSAIDPVRHLIGTVAGWGGNPANAALYAGAEPKQNDGKTV